MRDRIQFVETRESLSFVPLPNAWEVKHFKYRWMRRAAIWLFKKLGNDARQHFVTYTKHVIDTDRFMQALFEQQRALLNSYRTPTRLLIGSEDFSKMMQSEEMRNEHSFMAEYYSSDGRSKTMHGLKVEIIPWMRGILVMP